MPSLLPVPPGKSMCPFSLSSSRASVSPLPPSPLARRQSSAWSWLLSPLPNPPPLRARLASLEARAAALEAGGRAEVAEASRLGVRLRLTRRRPL